MRKTAFLTAAFAVAWVGFSTVALPQTAANWPALPAATRNSGQQILNKGLQYLLSTQKEDGSWQRHEGVTGLALMAFLQQPGGWTRHRQPVEKGLKFLAERQKEDGSIWSVDSPTVNTAIAITALKISGKPEFAQVIKKGQAYLVVVQFDEGEGVKPTDHGYGGVGYNAETRADLKNLHHVMEAMKATALPSEHEFWNKALTFLQRTQNLPGTNDQAWVGNDGGFVYRPGFSFAGETKSYGTMTHSGMLSYSFANVKKDDKRVQSAYKWIQDNYTLDENPGLGKTTLYYYYMVFAKSLRAMGEPSVKDAKGQNHNWRVELIQKLGDLQKPEGYWVNLDDPSYWQDNKDLVTAFTSIGLDHTLNDSIKY